MAGIVNGVFVEENKVFIGPAAPDVDSAGSFSNRFHTWQRKHRLHHVPFAEGRRNLGYRADVHPLDTHCRTPVLLHSGSRNNRFLQEGGLVIQCHIQRTVSAYVQTQIQRLLGLIHKMENVFLQWKRNTVITTFIRTRIGFGILVKYQDEGKRFFAFPGNHPSAHQRLFAFCIPFTYHIHFVLIGGLLDFLRILHFKGIGILIFEKPLRKAGFAVVHNRKQKGSVSGFIRMPVLPVISHPLARLLIFRRQAVEFPSSQGH